MEKSENLNLPFIMPSQAQKHVTHNEAIRHLDAIIQLSVKSATLSTPPLSPSAGERYIVPEEATGSWADNNGHIAAWQNGVWEFYTPFEGWLAWVEDVRALQIFSSSTWTTFNASSGSADTLAKLGINTAADDINRLSVSSDTTLFSHAGSDHRVKVNKSSSDKTASVVFQSEFVGKAEFGLLGDNHFGLKQSLDGTQWQTSAIFDQTSGAVSFPNNGFNENLMFNLLQDGGRFAGSPENPGTTAGTFVKPGYITAYNGSTFQEGGKFVHNNSTFGGSADPLDSNTQSLISKLKATEFSRRVGPEFYLMQVNAGNGTAAPLTTNSVTRHLMLVNRTAPLWSHSTWGVNIKAKSGSLSIPLDAVNEHYIDGILQTETLVIEPGDGWKQFVVVGHLNPMDSTDYNATLYRIYASQGAEMLMALPFIVPANIKPNPLAPFARIASIQAWR